MQVTAEQQKQAYIDRVREWAQERGIAGQQIDVLERLAVGGTYKSIAKELKVKKHNVRTRFREIKKALGYDKHTAPVMVMVQMIIKFGMTSKNLGLIDHVEVLLKAEPLCPKCPFGLHREDGNWACAKDHTKNPFALTIQCSIYDREVTVACK